MYRGDLRSRQNIQSNVECFDRMTWADAAANIVQAAIHKIILERGSCNVMLTGGRSAENFYRAWADIFDFEKLQGIQFFFGDERCVDPCHPQSNYRLVADTLFSKGFPENIKIFRMEAESADIEDAADRYASLLPEIIDVLLLGVGEDGHIASIFPHSKALNFADRCVIPVIGPKPPFRRITITPNIIRSAHAVFVLALGEEKRLVYEDALRNPDDIRDIPARLVLNRTWIFGD